MASFSNTRNKIQAILSSFMHEKDELSKERSTERDIAENPGLLSMLCQPRNRENFYERVETFSIWPMKPLFLSPQHCALYGWENTDVDLLTCVSCKATIDGMIGTEWDTDTYNSTCAQLRSSIINGHSKFCPWKETPCPESFLSLPARTSQEWKERFEGACRNLLSVEGKLPVLKREAFQELEITEDVLSILSSYIIDNDTSYHQDIIDTVCVLALCGWNTSSSDDDSSGILCCSACHREAGLWNFHSLNTVPLINNDGVNQGDGGIEEDTENNNGRSGSQGVMEEDIEGADNHDSTEQAVVDTGEVGYTQCNDGTPGDIIAKEEEMVCDCDVGNIRDEGSKKCEQLESNRESEDNGGTEKHIGMQEDRMVNEDDTTEDTECKNRSSWDMLVSHANDGDRSPEYFAPTCKMDPEASLSLEVENASDVQNISEAAESLDPEEYTNIDVSKMSPHHENTVEAIQDQKQTSNENVASELVTSREISTEEVKDASSIKNSSDRFNVQVNDESQLVENTSSEEHAHTGEMSIADQSSLSEQNTQLGQSSQLEQEPFSELESPSEQLPLSGKEHLSEQSPVSEKTSLSEEEPVPESKPLPEESTQHEQEILPEPAISGEFDETSDNQSPGSIQDEYTSESNVPNEQGGCAPEGFAGAGSSGMAIEPSRLFSTGVFSPAHSRQDSLIVEIGEESLSERMFSIQSDLLDRGETSSQMGSCRSLSEWSEGEVGEPSSKRLKIDGIERIEFDVLAEHRNWCPWITAVPSARNTTENVQKLPGWRILLEYLIQSSSPESHPPVKQTPSTQVWKSVRRLFHDCHSTIMRTTKSHVVEGKV